MKNLLLLLIVIAVLTSCKKEEIIVPNVPTTQYAFKQTAFMWQNQWGNQTGTYSVFTYQVAVMGDQPFDEVKFTLTVTLNDSTKVILTENELTNFGQTGFYSPEYQYPKYWVATITDSKGICPPFYNFTESDIYRFEYEATVRIGTNWYTLPKEGRKKTDPMDSFWI